ncbi:hypothetical protein NESM_000914400 [Novymonas esmeraldas]|uniref:Transmembrane protein n=1 Tax=Novymonas esmeraldas TaxID=1808958 RepID=A0AAW0F1X8_9TRYP
MGSVNTNTATASREDHPTMYVSSPSETEKVKGALHSCMHCCMNWFACSVSVLIMLMMRPVFISGRASALLEIVNTFSKISVFRAERYCRPPFTLKYV